MENRRSDAEVVKAAMRAYRERMAVRCQVCGAEPWEKCTQLNAARSPLQVPHITRGKPR